LNHRFFTASKAASCKDPRDRWEPQRRWCRLSHPPRAESDSR